MTARVTDFVLDDSVEYELAGASGHGLFDPMSHGLILQSEIPAAGRGHCCRYTIWEDWLLLESLFVASSDEPQPLEHCRPQKLEALDPKVLTGAAGTIDRLARSVGFNYVYREMNLAVPFTGGLLLARDSIPELDDPTGAHPAWRYREVVELVVEDGLVTAREDRSQRLAELRERVMKRLLEPGSEADRDSIADRVASTFSRPYRP